MPFLAVRLLYSASGAFNPEDSEFHKWKLFLFLAFFMEFIDVCIYLTSGIIIPLGDEEDGSSDKPPAARANRLKKWPRNRNRTIQGGKETTSSV